MLKFLSYILYPTILFWSFPSQAQKDTSWHSSIYIEAGGAGSLASINLEHYSFEKENYNIGARFGIGTARFRNFEKELQPDFFIPFGAFSNLKIIRNRPNPLYVYFGTGLIYASTVQSNSSFEPERVINLNAYIQLGTTYIFSNKFLLRLSYTPIISRKYGYSNWGALSFGYTF